MRHARPGLDRALRTFATVVEDESQSGFGLLAFDPTDVPAGLDDQDLAEWWGNDCWIRDLLWAVATTGRTPPIDWLMWMLTVAERGGTPQLSALLATDLRDMSRVAFRAGCGSRSELQRVSHRSPVRVFQWLTSNNVAMATTVGRVLRPSGSVRITRAWMNGCLAAEGDEFDALIQACAHGCKALVVEMDHGYRRHALVPIDSVDRDNIDADRYCVDLLRRKGGWMSRLGTWTWDDGPTEPLPPLASLTELLASSVG